MVYGFKTVAITKKQVEEMEVAEMKMFRFVMGVTRNNKIRNEYIRGKVNRTVKNENERGRLRWYGRVMRRDKEYIGRRVMEMELRRKRKRGRPKRRFLNAVKEDMEEVGAREKDVVNRTLEGASYTEATPD